MSNNKQQARYDITGLDGSVRQMTTHEIAAETGIKLGTIQKRISQQGMRTIEKLGEDPRKTMARARKVFSQQSGAHFAEEKRKREAEASRGLRPHYRDFVGR